MSATINTGPNVVIGPCAQQTTSTGVAVGIPVDNSVEFGPDIQYLGQTVLDIRQMVQKDYGAAKQGAILAQLNGAMFCSVDRVPAAFATNNIAASQGASSGTAMALATTPVAGINPAVPFYQFKTNTLVSGLMLDFGFATTTSAAGSSSVVISSGVLSAVCNTSALAMQFYPGMWICIANGTNNTTSLFTYVTSTSATTIYLANAPGVTSAAAAIGTCNIPNVQTWPNATPVGWAPYLAAGIAGIFDPQQCTQRAVCISAAAGNSGGTFVVSGWTIYGEPQTAVISITTSGAGGSAGIYYTSKTFKAIASITPQQADTGHNYTAGTSDLFGFAVRTDKFEYTETFYNATFVASAGTLASGGTIGVFTSADLTNPATVNTGDPRGTFQFTSNGPTTGGTGPSTNNAIRVALYTALAPYQIAAASPTNPVAIYGVTPA